MNPLPVVGSPFDTPAMRATQGERPANKITSDPVRAECIAQQGVSKHEWSVR